MIKESIEKYAEITQRLGEGEDAMDVGSSERKEFIQSMNLSLRKIEEDVAKWLFKNGAEIAINEGFEDDEDALDSYDSLRDNAKEILIKFSKRILNSGR